MFLEWPGTQVNENPELLITEQHDDNDIFRPTLPFHQYFIFGFSLALNVFTVCIHNVRRRPLGKRKNMAMETFS